MCGICGQINSNGKPVERDRLVHATRLLTHRGPDDEGYYINGSVGLGMRRLSIIDLDTGNQPVFNENRKICIVFNGELYNYLELKDQLVTRGHVFTTKSDTEVVVHLYEEYGNDCLLKMNGMFALAIWNDEKKELFVARDRLGIKPVYYSLKKEMFVFASELKGVVDLHDGTFEVNPHAIDSYLSFLYIPAPETIYDSVHKLSPGHYLVFKEGTITVKKYWDLPQMEHIIEDRGQRTEDRKKKIEEEYAQKVFELLNDSVKKRLMSDVPFGAFLSGGIDSAIIVALMSRNMSLPPKTFSIGFGEKTFDELSFASIVAERFGTDHKEFIVQPPDLTALLNIIVNHFDEPFADSSAIPTYIVSQMASTQVKMVLSGDGGDELFGGYDRYRAYAMSKKYPVLLYPLRTKLAGKMVNGIGETTDIHGFSKRIKRFIYGLRLPDRERYLFWMSQMHNIYKQNLYTDDFREKISAAHDKKSIHKLLSENYINVEDIMKYDIKTYLPDDLLTKVDRMSMANSLEVRVPFLDHKLVEYSVSIPVSFKIKRMKQKYILRKTFEKILPEKIVKRKKHGFGVPLGAWFKKDLAGVIHDIIEDSLLVKKNFFRKSGFKKIFNEHRDGIVDHGQRLFALLILELWFRKQ